jgi:hypothetical protein
MSEQATRTSAADSPWRTIDEVAAHYRTTPATVRYWRKTGYGPRGRRVGQHVRYHVDEIERFDRESDGATAAEPTPAA